MSKATKYILQRVFGDNWTSPSTTKYFTGNGWTLDRRLAKTFTEAQKKEYIPLPGERFIKLK